jgi:hypothetical protein
LLAITGDKSPLPHLDSGKLRLLGYGLLESHGPGAEDTALAQHANLITYLGVRAGEQVISELYSNVPFAQTGTRLDLLHSYWPGRAFYCQETPQSLSGFPQNMRRLLSPLSAVTLHPRSSKTRQNRFVIQPHTVWSPWVF